MTAIEEALLSDEVAPAEEALLEGSLFGETPPAFSDEEAVNFTPVDDASNLKNKGKNQRKLRTK